jgi:hypothetical protein
MVDSRAMRWELLGILWFEHVCEIGVFDGYGGRGVDGDSIELGVNDG